MNRLLLIVPLLSLACTDADPDDEPGDDEPQGVPALGAGSHDLGQLEVLVVASSEDDLDEPTDLAVDPRDPERIWVTNRGDNSIVRVEGAGTEQSSSEHFNSYGSKHFLARPAGIAFSDFDNFATAQDTDEQTQSSTPSDFMGPTLWDDSSAFDGGHGGHLDMLHNSPLGGGIAWEADNVYWIFDGYHGALTRYDFADDHGYGGADHSDGVIARYAEEEVARVDAVPAGLEMDREDGLLYAADTANGRIAVLDTATGEQGRRITPDYDGGSQYKMSDADLWTLVAAEDADGMLEHPSGIALHDDLVFVSDNATGHLLAFDLDGELFDWVDLGRPGALGGIDFDPDGRLYVVDMAAEEVLRISAK